MYRQIPRSNKLLDVKWKKEKLELHKQRLKTIQPILTTRFKVSTPIHLLNNNKGRQLFEGKCID